MADGQTPSPVRDVRRFEQDEAEAKRLQQLYDDESRAAALQEAYRVEQEFDEATRKVNDERSQKAMVRLVGKAETPSAAAEKK